MTTKKEKFIPLRDYVLGKRVFDKRPEKELKTASGLFLTADVDNAPIPTNRLNIVEVGSLVDQSDLVKVGAQVVFDMKGNSLTLNGEEYILTNELNLLGVVECP